MQKIISLFKRKYDGGPRHVFNEVVDGAEWVALGEGIATRKHDGTCCMVRSNVLYRRYTLKEGRVEPLGFEPVTQMDEQTGKQEGWVPVGDSQADKWHRQAWHIEKDHMADGTYELCGPKVQGNPERLHTHRLIEHGVIEMVGFPRTFGEIKRWFYDMRHDPLNVEGVVWHHPDGRMVKIKSKDFGIERHQS